jgi:gamma-polyglutamate biosynthesis protein CapA
MKIALLGDIALFGKNDLVTNTNLYEYYKLVAEYLSGFDLVVGNLETPFSSTNKTYGGKSAYIKSNPRNVEILKYLNVSAVNLANNHIYDYGYNGYSSTKNVLSDNNILYFGDSAESLKLNIKSNKVALNGYCCYSTNPLGINGPAREGINALNVEAVLKSMDANNKLGYNNLISVHAGQEHVNYPSSDHIKMAHLLSQTCPYVFYGHHPHVIQGIEEVDKSLIAYSLGNFCFDDVYVPISKYPLIKQSQNNKSSFILALNYSNNQLAGFEILPIFAGDTHLEIGAENILSDIKKYSQAFSLPCDKYSSKRDFLIANYLNSRKSKRNFKWYLQRLKYRYINMLFRSFYNSYMYKKNVKKYLSSINQS